MKWFLAGLRKGMGRYDKDQPLSAHENAHRKACRGMNLPFHIEYRGKEPVIASSVGWGKRGHRQAAIFFAAGVLAGGGDSHGDREEVEQHAPAGGWTPAQAYDKARRYV